MDSKGTCIACGAAILPATAQRTNGKCMPCFQDSHGLRSAQLLGERTPTDKLLHTIEQALMATVLRVASNAADTLTSEGIYGCCLFHTQFLSVAGLTIFTEATARAGARWSPCDSLHHLYLPNEFRHTAHLFLALEYRCGGDDVASEIECICLRVLRRLRESSLFAPRVLLTLAEGDQSWEQRYAYAELFSVPEALEAFRTDVPPLDWQEVEHWRSQIPSFDDATNKL